MRWSVSAALAAALVTACATPVADPPPAVSVADLHLALGDTWTGTLTYRDYSAPYGDVTLDVEAKITPLTDGIQVALHYPKEPAADGTRDTRLSEDGRKLDGASVTARTQSGGTLTVETEEACEDDDRPALCRHVHVFAPDAISWSKFVTFEEGAEPVRRNAYAFHR